MKKSLVLLFLIVFAASAVFAFGEGPPAESSNKQASSNIASGVFLIDNFESGSIKSPTEWWVFDIETGSPVNNSGLTAGDASVAGKVGNYSLLLKGRANNWYAGGCGTYVAKPNINYSNYNTFQIDVYGNGPGSGTIKVELWDDDNKNWEAEQDPTKSYAPVYDDKWIYDIRVDWQGWRRVTVPLEDFVDEITSVGDNILNLDQSNGSGGLLQVQFVCLASKSTGLVNLNIDNIALLNVTD